MAASICPAACSLPAVSISWGQAHGAGARFVQPLLSNGQAIWGGGGGVDISMGGQARPKPRLELGLWLMLGRPSR